ncbi:hypothetical protein [Nonomuraea salmonea]|uniref:Antitoxin n=1 Tax=Nonomuraea salmonea TaxID=46181 RepID=A0ABV5P329_9ACTN
MAFRQSKIDEIRRANEELTQAQRSGDPNQIVHAANKLNEAKGGATNGEAVAAGLQGTTR